MHVFLRTAVAAALAAALAAGAQAQAPPSPAPPASAQGAPSPTPPASAPAAPSPAPKKHVATSHSASGTIEAYDAATHTLTVKLGKTTRAFDVSRAQVLVGSKRVTDEALARPGAKVSVRYTLKKGQRVASRVRVTPAS